MDEQYLRIIAARLKQILESGPVDESEYFDASELSKPEVVDAIMKDIIARHPHSQRQ